MMDKLKERIGKGIEELKASFKKGGSNKVEESSNPPSEQASDQPTSEDAGATSAAILEDNIGSKEDKSNNLRYKQYARLFVVTAVFVSLALVYVMVDLSFLGSVSGFSNSSASVKKRKETDGDLPKIELATESIKGAEKWNGYFEDKLADERAALELQINSLKDAMEGGHKKSVSVHSKEFEEINRRLSATLNELENVRAQNASIQENIQILQAKDEIVMPRNIDLQDIADDSDIEPSVSSFNYIPATSLVEGYILGGLSVSTSVNAASEPIPVGIKLKGATNLPKDFAMKLNDCRILAGAYGDISSERAVVRADQLICENKEEGLITNTKISGVIYGDDGLNGIRGTVVSMSGKHLKNAFVSGMLSGAASVAGGKDGLTLGPSGALSTQKKSPKDLVEGGLLGGMTSSSEKLADYHIKLAENISPVILVPSGTKVNIMFTKGVFVGSQGIKSKIKRERKKR